ncbi:ImmA/IrrE family metallo-endopeptidase [Listeria fleischmannii]|uniref:ImmA/IrrE family metallo-endopeptidase n=1 Tax=Listeria fleischmannii TaxID=1069827 RepID=UPI0016292037|nr:ImmA/IrrE family metallo-endopeptidase [Listeria fleischmannii]MBC1417924.1 ImmA/IrrE family metallo-endopeptidase [Listeria fleischmannii]
MFEELMNDYQNKVTIKEEKMPSKLPGLYMNGTILIDSKKTDIEKRCLLIEELMHWKYTYGSIIDQKNISNRKQEIFARRRGYEELIPLEDIIHCFYNGFREYFEVAEHLHVTEEFLIQTVAHYREKYGSMYNYKNYYINFGNTIDVYRKY